MNGIAKKTWEFCGVSELTFALLNHFNKAETKKSAAFIHADIQMETVFHSMKPFWDVHLDEFKSSAQGFKVKT